VNKDGLLVAFDRPVINGDLHRHSFIVLRNDLNPGTGLECWCEVQPEAIHGVKFFEDCVIGGFEVVNDPNDLVTGARFIAQRRFEPGFEYRVVIKGDFIRAEDGRGLDANHLPPWLPARKTGDGVEGGVFESWFTLVKGAININRATREEFMLLPGIGTELAEAIVVRRREQPFANVAELLDVPGIGEARFKKVQKLLKV